MEENYDRENKRRDSEGELSKRVEETGVHRRAWLDATIATGYCDNRTIFRGFGSCILYLYYALTHKISGF